ncbi:MAG TPA: helix-turn-helix transcriptional regulator [Xanthobacteraceae bacterium]|nr:helix-turn-helix transcriptional regulator [Xanthobacteraceae bacterium]
MVLYEHIAATIRRLRTEKGWSQEKLAQQIGEPANTVSRWETVTYKPSAEQLEKLARLFSQSITIFFPGMEQQTAVPSALLSATRGLKPAELKAVIEYAEFTRARSILKMAAGKRSRGRK